MPGSRLGITTISIFGSAGIAHAQTWISTCTTNWSAGSNRDIYPTAPASGTNTAVEFFARL